MARHPDARPGIIAIVDCSGSPPGTPGYLPVNGSLEYALAGVCLGRIK